VAKAGSTQRRPENAVAAFAQAWRELRCARRAHTTTFGALFVLPLELSCYVGEVRVTPLVEG
jgi:hypothetical protein